jgi:hypothetical protein
MTNQSNQMTGPSLRKRGRVESALNTAAKSAVSSALATAGPLGTLGNQLAPAIIDSITDRLFAVSLRDPVRPLISSRNLRSNSRGGDSMNPRPRKGNPSNALRRQRLISQGAKNRKNSLQGISSLPNPPVAVATQISGQKYVRGLRAQVETDLSGKGMKIDSERVKFSDMVAVAIGIDSTPHVQQPFNYGSGTFKGTVPVSPATISARLVQIEEVYGFYAFRDLTFTYVPYVGTSTAGAFGFAYDMAYDVSQPALTTGIALDAVLQHEEAIAAPVWERSSVSFRFTGSKLWSTTANVTVDVPTDFYQGVLWGCGSNVAASTNYGRLLVNGTVDFYKAIEINTVAPSLRIQAIWDRYVRMEWLQYRLTEGAEELRFRDFQQRYGESIKNREVSRVMKRSQAPLLLYDPERKTKEGP